MLHDNYLRLSLTLDDNNATTIQANIVKLIEAVLYAKNNESLTIDKISELIGQMFNLEFEQNELIKAINRSRSSDFIRIDNQDPIYHLYRLTPKRYEIVKSKISFSEVDRLLKEFIDYSQRDVNFIDFKELILNFLYQAFSSDVRIIQCLMNGEYSGIINNAVNSEAFSNEEKALINSFLNWPNRNKDKFVYNSVSCGYEYCMLSLKKDNSFKYIFSGKVFYLDSNVIFRLMGLNKAERRNTMQVFIEKCNNVGIKIKYTNFTRAEIENTIDYHVENVKNFFNNKEPIKIEVIQELSEKYSNLGFIEEYENWTKSPNHKVGDYNSFNKYLKRRAYRLLDGFDMEVSDDYETFSRSNKFEEYLKDFELYKTGRGRKTYEGSLKVDINNFLFIREKNKEQLNKNVTGINYFIISVDHSYIEWSKKILYNVIPLIVLPSTWYSLILKYEGRTPDDFTAFTQFLNLRINEDNFDDKKNIILKKILDMPEKAEIREEMILDISQNLKGSYRDIEVDEIIERSYESVIENKMMNSREEEIERLLKEHEGRIDEILSEKLKQGSIDKEIEIYKHLLKDADRNARKIQKKSWIKFILFWICPAVIIICVTGILYFWTGNQLTACIGIGISFVSLFLPKLYKGRRYLKIKNDRSFENARFSYLSEQCKRIGIDYEKLKDMEL